MLKFIADPRLSAYREFVVSRASEFNAAGFPVMPAVTAATAAEVPAGPAFDVFAVAPKTAAEVPVPPEPPTEEIPVAVAPPAPEVLMAPPAPEVLMAPPASEVPVAPVLVFPAPVAARINAPSAPPAAQPGPGRMAGTGRKDPPPARRRRMSGRRAIVAGVGALAVTMLFAVLGFSGIPAAMRASGPVITPPSSANAPAPPGGGADVAVPVKVKRPSSVRSSLPPVLTAPPRPRPWPWPPPCR